MKFFHLLNHVFNICEYHTATSSSSISSFLYCLESLDILEELMIIPRELLAPEGLFEGQGIIIVSGSLKLGRHDLFKLESPHVSLTVFNTHPLKNHANNMTKVLMRQVIEAGKSLMKFPLIPGRDRGWCLLNEESGENHDEGL